MSLLDSLLGLLRSLGKPPQTLAPPQCTKFGISSADLQAILVRDLGVPPEHCHLSDTVYDLYSKGTLQTFLNQDDTNRTTYVPESQDCFMPETPVICRIAGIVEIREIQDLATTPFPVEVLDHRCQWTPVSSVWQKVSDRPVVDWCHRGSIAVTSDHRVVSRGSWTSAENAALAGVLDQVPIGQVLDSNGLSDTELAWAFGLVFSDGHIGPRRRSSGTQWRLSNYNRDYLERAGSAFSRAYSMDFGITAYKSEKEGVKRGGVTPRADMLHLEFKKRVPYTRDLKRERLCQEFRRSFYSSGGFKKVPAEILSATRAAKRSFLDGVWAGDGDKTKGIHLKRLTVHGKIGLLGLIALCESIGAEFKVIVEPRRENTYYLSFRESHEVGKSGPRFNRLKQDSPRAKAFRKLPTQTRTVYDLTCVGGEFIASNYKVHNCDDFAYELLGNESKWSAPPKGDPNRKGSSAFGIIWGQIQGVGAHALNWWVNPDDMKAYLVEPQNDNIYLFPSGSVAWVVFS